MDEPLDDEELEDVALAEEVPDDGVPVVEDEVEELSALAAGLLAASDPEDEPAPLSAELEALAFASERASLR